MERWTVMLENGSTTACITRGDGDGVCLLAHGAGGNMDHRNIVGLSEVVRNCGMDVVRFNFPYRERGSGPPDRMPVLMSCLSSIVNDLRERFNPSRLVIGGHSMGGRAASMLAADGFNCDGLLLFAYPLHPSSDPQRLRAAHLEKITCPTLALSGTRDKLCTVEIMNRVPVGANWRIHWIEGADHGFDVLKRSGRTRDEVFEELTGTCRDWLRGLAP